MKFVTHMLSQGITTLSSRHGCRPIALHVTRYARETFHFKTARLAYSGARDCSPLSGTSTMNRHALSSDIPFRDPISLGGRSVVIRRPTMSRPEDQDRSFVHHKSTLVVRRQFDDRQSACPAIRIRFRHSSHAHQRGSDTGSPCRRQTAHRLCVGCKRNGRLQGRRARMGGPNQFLGR